MNALSHRIETEPRTLADLTIAERLDHIEHMLKFVPLPWYRRELMREYLAYTTDPEEQYANR